MEGGSEHMGQTLLIIDDSEAVRNRVKESVASCGLFDTILEAPDGLLGFKLLREHSVDLVLCDLIMRGVDGFKFLALKRSDPRFDDVPVILLTGQETVSSKVRALDSGASDYLVKPFDDAELVARLRVHLKVKQLQDALREKNRELEDLSRRDPLTGVANRRAFHELLDAEFARCARYGRPFSFMMVDLDHFKNVNDTHGHQAGDLALITTAKTLVGQLRTNDMVGRYGGEEFAVILPETAHSGAMLVAERCRVKIASTPLIYADTVFSVTASMGLASVPDPRASTTEAMIRLADEALYDAKRQGRNRLIAA